jgi:hypothetical protein
MGQNIVKIRKSAIFMHFDNLNGKLDSNAKFDYLFNRLLKNTQQTLAMFYSSGGLNEGNKKMAILMTLGASLHMVQDFYSHSNWTHNDFAALGVPPVKTSWGKERAPTWFEVRAKLGDPAHWPFKVRSGIYPPQAGSIYTHTHMNHDNSQLVYEEDDKPGKPRLPQAKYHEAGPYPVSKAGAAEHQLFAVNSAAGASIEWVGKVEQSPLAKAAIEYAKDWNLTDYNPMMLHDLENCLTLTLVMSCAAGSWDGGKPPGARGTACNGVMGAGAAMGAGAVVMGPLGPLGGAPAVAMGIGVPLAAMFLNEYWAIHTRFNLCEHLTQGFASQSGDYDFPGM